MLRIFVVRPVKPVFAERVLDYAGLPLALKRAIWLAAAVLLLNIALIAAHHLVEGPVHRFESGIQMGAGAVVIAGVLFLLALTVFVSGLARTTSHWRWVFVLACFSLFALPLVWFMSQTPVAWKLGIVVTFAVVPFLFLSILFWQAKHLRLFFLATCSAMAIFAIAASAAALIPLAKALAVPEITLAALGGIILLAYPVFYMAGADFAEISDSLLHNLHRAMRRYIPRWAAVILLLAIGVASTGPWLYESLYGAKAWSETLSLLGSAGLPLIATLCLYWALRRSDRVPNRRIPAFAILIGTVLLAVIIYALDQRKAPAPPPHYNDRAAPHFAVKMPEGWAGRRLNPNEPHASKVLFRRGRGLPWLIIASMQHAALSGPVTINTLLHGGERLPPTEMPELAEPDVLNWRKFQAEIDFGNNEKHKNNPLVVVGWQRPDLDDSDPRLLRTWYIVGVVRSTGLAEALPAFEQFKGSFYPTPPDQSLHQVRIVLLSAFGLITLLVALVVWRGTFAPNVTAGLMFGGVLAAFAVGHGLATPGGKDLLDDLNTDAGMLWAVMFTAFVATALYRIIGLTPWHTVRPNVGRALVDLNLSLIMIALLFLAFRAMSLLGNEYNTVKAAVALLTIAWDLCISGGAITNHSSVKFPREARLLMHLGFAQIVAVAVFVWFPWKTGERSVLGFDAEMLVATGLVNTGVPLVLAVAALRAVPRWKPRLQPK